MLWKFSEVHTVCEPYIYGILRKSPKSSHLKLIVLVHFTYTIVLHVLLYRKSCGMVEYIENSRVRTSLVRMWKGSLIPDGIDDLPY